MLNIASFVWIALPAVADKAAPRQPSADDAAAYQSFLSFDWRWFLFFLVGASLSFGIILFGLLFFRRWGVPRLGYFFVTIVVLMNRFMEPAMIFWQAFGVVAGAVSLVMAFYQMRHHRFVAGREPVYFLLNAFALVVCSLSTSGYSNGLAAVALAASLFFITTRNPRKPGRHGKADQHVLESLERRASRK